MQMRMMPAPKSRKGDRAGGDFICNQKKGLGFRRRPVWVRAPRSLLRPAVPYDTARPEAGARAEYSVPMWDAAILISLPLRIPPRSRNV